MIKEVLKSAATEEVIDAWGKAYRFLADILIGREKGIYKAHSDQARGWNGFKLFKIDSKVKESDIITYFYLKPVDSNALPVYLPGQYITIRIPTAEGSTTMRNYSLSDKPGLDYFRISVKREKTLNLSYRMDLFPINYMMKCQ